MASECVSGGMIVGERTRREEPQLAAFRLDEAQRGWL